MTSQVCLSVRPRRCTSAAPRPAAAPAKCGLVVAVVLVWLTGIASALSIAASADRSADAAAMSRDRIAERRALRSRCLMSSPAPSDRFVAVTDLSLSGRR